jgi:hypothetical protein
MKFVLALVALIAIGLTVNFVRADEGAEHKGHEVTLKGTALCGKCELKQDEKCDCILQVKEKDGKEVLYYLSGKVNHKKDFCQGTKEVKVTGFLSDKDGKKHIEVTKLEAE